MSTFIRSPLLSSADQALIISIDQQEKLMAVIPDADQIVQRAEILLKAARVLDIPTFGTEQYPEGLGKVLPALQPYVSEWIPKKRFSSAEAVGFPVVGERDDERSRAVLIGIETHVCVLQTAFDLQAMGYEIVLPVDTISSQREQDREVALRRMENAGMTLTTSESLIFEWSETANHPEFKQLSRIVTGRD